MKVFVLAPQENWICDRIAAEWKKYCSDITTDNIKEADVVWLLAGWCWNHVPMHILNDKKVILTVHHIVPDKFDNLKLREFQVRDQFVNAYHVPNVKTAEFVKQLTNKPIFISSYWYDPDCWSPLDKSECRNILNLPEEKFIVGSFQRDTEGGTKNPKLEKGPDLFCDYVEKLNKEKNIHVLLGGWRREYVIERLQKAGIPFSFFEKVPLEQLKIMYGACDLYVVASRFEGGPQAILEASAMKVPIISRDVGIANVILEPNCVIDIPNESFIPGEDSVEKNYQNVQDYSIVLYKSNYIQMFKRVLK